MQVSLTFNGGMWSWRIRCGETILCGTAATREACERAAVAAVLRRRAA